MTVPIGVCKSSARVIFFFYCNMPVCLRSFVWAQDNSGPKIRNFHYGQYILFPFPSLPFPSLPLPSLFPSFPVPFPLHPISLPFAPSFPSHPVTSLPPKSSKGVWGKVSSSSGSGQSPAAKSYLLNIQLMNGPTVTL